MAAIDTNIVVRFLAADDLKQAEQATRQIEQGVWVSHSVLIETEWVLRASFGWGRARINDALRNFLALRHVEAELHVGLLWALDRHRAGADWADMLHLIAARQEPSFLTFDLNLPKGAGTDSPVAVEVLR